MHNTGNLKIHYYPIPTYLKLGDLANLKYDRA